MYYNLKDFLLSIDVYSVFSNFLFLKETKNGYLALCPFHLDKTPSFFLNSFTKRYYCFACHKKGNILTFVMDYKKFSFRESLDFLSVYFLNGCNFKKKISRSFELVNLVSNLYFKNLKKNYFLNKDLNNFFYKRNLSFDDINSFKLGFSENKFNWLSYMLFKFGYLRKHLSSSGLFFIKDDSFYDRFRNRIVFPIRNIYGQIIAFGGRSLNDKFKPKYINSSETTFFSKKSEFYGLYESFTRIKSGTIIIVEGYMDVITLHKHGIQNVIAVLGTSFTKEHFKKISSLYKNIIFCYDGDDAGRSATIRTAFSCLQYLQYGITLSFILLPFGHDPDSFIRSGFKSKFLFLLKNPIYILDLVFNRFIFKFKTFYNNKINFFSELFKLINTLANLYLRKILFFYFFKKCFENESLIFDYVYLILDKNEKIKVFPLGLCASYFLFKNDNLTNNIDLNVFLNCHNIYFFSDINVFFEVAILLKRNILIDLNIINKFIFNKINLNEFKHISYNDSIDVFMSLVDKIYKRCS
ncbi:MAG TPA: DNA primase [Candidatus Azoamicus sp.]